jgi:predicted RNase H-related nuclease YkuK (DUF458 family)
MDNSSKINIDEIKNFLYNQSPDTKIYIGCDSVKFKKGDVWFAEYALVVIVHINGKNGCKIFGEIQTERDYDKKVSRPSFRLMNEVYKVSELYLRLADVISDRDIEVHLDINPNKKYGSSCVVQEAIGYIRGVCQVDPVIKPDSWAAAHCADHMLRNRSLYKNIMNDNRNYDDAKVAQN